MNELDQLYQQVILDHSRERHGSGALEAPDATSHQVNPTCGDDVTLGVRVKDGKIEAVGWEGDGCSISQASISVMHDLVNGADLARRITRVPARTDLILRTSGSTTGTGRLIAMSATALMASARATHARLGGPGTWLLTLPAHHVAGLQILTRSLEAGTEPVIVDTSAGFSPTALAEAEVRARTAHAILVAAGSLYLVGGIRTLLMAGR